MTSDMMLANLLRASPVLLVNLWWESMEDQASAKKEKTPPFQHSSHIALVNMDDRRRNLRHEGDGETHPAPKTTQPARRVTNTGDLDAKELHFHNTPFNRDLAASSPQAARELWKGDTKINGECNISSGVDSANDILR